MIKKKSVRKSLQSSASLLGLAAGAAGWSSVARAESEDSQVQTLLLPEHYDLSDNGVVTFSLQTGEQLTLNPDQYVILQDGLLLITDEIAQASMQSLPVMGAIRAQLSDLEQVTTIDGIVAEATPAQTLAITEGRAPRLFEDVDIERFELASHSEDPTVDHSDGWNPVDGGMLLGGTLLAVTNLLSSTPEKEAEPEEETAPEEEAVDPFGNLVPSNDLFIGTYNDGSPGQFSAESYFGTDSGSPSSEKIENAFDGDMDTKYLNFKEDGGLLLDFDRAVTPTKLDIREANDFAPRNPNEVKLYWSTSDLEWGDAGWTLAYTADFENPNGGTFKEVFTDNNLPFNNAQAAQYWKIEVVSTEYMGNEFQFSNIDMGLDWGNDSLADL